MESWISDSSSDEDEVLDSKVKAESVSRVSRDEGETVDGASVRTMKWC